MVDKEPLNSSKFVKTFSQYLIYNDPTVFVFVIDFQFYVHLHGFQHSRIIIKHCSQLQEAFCVNVYVRIPSAA